MVKNENLTQLLKLCIYRQNKKSKSASNCNNNSTTLAANAVAGIVILKDKDPWKTGDAAVQSGAGFTKGKTNVRNNGNIIEIRSCWGDGCTADDRRLSSVQAE